MCQFRTILFIAFRTIQKLNQFVQAVVPELQTLVDRGEIHEVAIIIRAMEDEINHRTSEGRFKNFPRHREGIGFKDGMATFKAALYDLKDKRGLHPLQTDPMKVEAKQIRERLLADRWAPESGELDKIIGKAKALCL